MRSYLFAFLLIIAAPMAAGADLCQGTVRVPIEIDAAALYPGDSLPPGKYCFDVTIADALASKKVFVKWEHQKGEEPPLPSGTGQAVGEKAAKKDKADAAAARTRELKSLLSATKIQAAALQTEASRFEQKKILGGPDLQQAFQVRDALREAGQRQKDLEADLAEAEEQERQAKEELKALSDSASALPSHYAALGSGDKEILKVWIDAKDAQGDPTRTYTFEVEPSGKWQLGYGFLFIPGRDQEYYSRVVDEGFVVSRKSRRGALTFAPGLIWSWYPSPSHASACLFEGLTCGLAAGIAADSSSPILFAGVQGTYHQNISFNLGVAVHQEKRLAGEYHEGQSLTESIDSDTLNKSVYRPNIYFGVSFRFDKSPF